MKPSSRSLSCVLAVMLTSSTAFADEEKKAESDTTSQSISVSVSSSTQDDGVNEPKSEVTGRILIKGPDGVLKEYKLGDSLPGGLKLNLNENDNSIRVLLDSPEAVDPRPMIGVRCRPVSDLLRTHLKLGINGVVVTELPKGLPAEKAGLVVGDIILTADGKNITNQQDLSVVVREAAEKEFSMEVIHEGDRKTLTVMPEMTNPADMPGYSIGGNPENLQRMLLRGMGPALQLQDDENMERQFAELLEKARSRTLSAQKQAEDVRRRAAEVRKQAAEAQNGPLSRLTLSCVKNLSKCVIASVSWKNGSKMIKRKTISNSSRNPPFVLTRRGTSSGTSGGSVSSYICRNNSSS